MSELHWWFDPTVLLRLSDFDTSNICSNEPLDLSRRYHLKACIRHLPHSNISGVCRTLLHAKKDPSISTQSQPPVDQKQSTSSTLAHGSKPMIILTRAKTMA